MEKKLDQKSEINQEETKEESQENGFLKSKTTRREFVKNISTAGAIVGATSIIGAPNIVRAAGSTGPIKMASLLGKSGIFAMWGIPMDHGVKLAVKEINQGYTLVGGHVGLGGLGSIGRVANKAPVQGVKTGTTNKGGALQDAGVVYNEADDILIPSGEKGILGRELQLLDPDTQSENKRAQSLTKRMILDEKVDVIQGAIASSEREAIRPIIDKHKQLYFYNVQYEGGVADKVTFCTGVIPEQQLICAIQHANALYGPNVYCMILDYVSGHNTLGFVQATQSILGHKIVQHEIVPMSVSQFSSSIARIQKAKPDWILTWISGENHSQFFPQAYAAGLDIPMYSCIHLAQSYDHLRFAAPTLEGMHVTVNYMEEIPTARNRAFVKRWRQMWPDDIYITDLAEDSYIGVHLYAKAVRIAGTTDQEKVIEALESGIGMETPEGWVFMDPATHHLSHYVRLGRCDKNHNISFLNEWPSMEPWWLRRNGVNLVRHPEYKQYAAPDDPYLKEYF